MHALTASVRATVAIVIAIGIFTLARRISSSEMDRSFVVNLAGSNCLSSFGQVGHRKLGHRQQESDQKQGLGFGKHGFLDNFRFGVFFSE